MEKNRKDLFLEVAREVGLNIFFAHGLPWIKKSLGKSVTKEDREVVSVAREHALKGEYKEAQKLLARHMMGWGLNDEQVFDEDLSAVVRAGLATEKQVLALQSWLAGDTPEKRRLRSRFRNSLTLQETPQSRMEVISSYAKLSSDAKRDARMQATGKLDDEFDEAVWKWVRVKVPGVTRTAWDAFYNGTSKIVGGIGATVGSSAGTFGGAVSSTGVAVRNSAVAVNNELSAWGLALQAAHPAPPARVRSGLVTFVMRMIR